MQRRRQYSMQDQEKRAQQQKREREREREETFEWGPAAEEKVLT